MSDEYLMLTTARAYLGAGFSVIPIEPHGKKPAIPKWKQYQKRPPTEQELVDWFGATDDNIGLVMGTISGHAFAFDFDDKGLAGFAFDLPKLAKETFIQETAHGVHVVFRADGEPVKTHNYRDRGLDLDLKGEGGYIIAAPSVHETGQIYRMLSPTVQVGTIDSKKVEELVARLEKEWPLVHAVLLHYSEGRRHEIALGLAAWLRRQGYSSDRAGWFMRGLGRAAEDAEGEDRARAVGDTFRKPEREISVAGLGPDLLADLDRFKTALPPAAEDGPRLFDDIKAAIREHYYFELEWHYTIAALYVLQCSVFLSLPAVFYLFFPGSFGSGKTNILGLIAALTGSVSLENVSVAALAHELGDGRPVAIDEYDVPRGKDIDEVRNALVRQGYKRTAAPYTRHNPLTHQNERIPIFGPKALTFRGSIEMALQSRGYPIPTVKAKGAEGYEYVLNNLWTHLGELPARIAAWGRTARDTFSDVALEEMGRSPAHREAVEAVCIELGANRSSELATVGVLVAHMAGVDVVADLRKANALGDMETAASEEDDREDLYAVVGALSKQQLDNKARDLLGEAQVIRHRQREVFDGLNKLKAERHEKTLTVSQFNALRREAGIKDEWRRNHRGSLVWNLPAEWVESIIAPPAEVIVEEEQARLRQEPPLPGEAILMVHDVLAELGKANDGLDASLEDVLRVSAERGIPRERAEGILKRMRTEGDTFEPSAGRVRLVDSLPMRRPFE